MGSDVVIRAQGLGKTYLIGHQAERERYIALRDVIARKARNFTRGIDDFFHGRANVSGDRVEEFAALKDVSFEVRRGEVVGVIGRNGAGKSTLLKILSRITEPSAGRVELRGRVASLLEVGTGFHPELTGRENIYLNGAILGMTRSEVRLKFEGIVAFAEIAKFLDTPVKRYSSGMYVRLAFAVAAHLEPEILIVDEVLAVGDAEFQRKCIGKMTDIARGGRTVLFVSHSLPTVRSLCDSAILLQDGAIAFYGDVRSALALYSGVQTQSLYSASTDRVAKNVYVSRCSVECHGDENGFAILDVRIFSAGDTRVAINLYLKDHSAGLVGMASIGGMGMPATRLQPRENCFRIMLDTARLAKGRYLLSIAIDSVGRERLDTLDDVLSLENDPPFVKGCSEVLHQEWRQGFIHIQSELL